MLLKTQIFEKKATFPVKKKFWPPFSRTLEQDKCQGKNCKGPQGLLTFTVQVISLFLQDPRAC